MTERNKKALALADQAVQKADTEHFKSSFDNQDRVHLKLSFATQGGASLILCVPESWGEERAVTLATLLAKEQHWQITDRVETSDRGTIFANAYARSACHTEGRFTAIDIDWPRMLTSLHQAGVENVEIRFRARSASTVKADPCDIEWTRIDHAEGQTMAALVPTNAQTRSMHLRFGNTSVSSRVKVLIAMGMFIIPLVITFTLGALAIQRARLVQPGSQFQYSPSTAQLGLDVLPSGYIVPPQGKQEGLLFTRKNRAAMQKPVIYFGFFPGFLVIFLGVLLMALISPNGKGTVALAVCIGGLVIGFGIMYVAIITVSFTSMRSFYAPLRKMIEERYGINVAEGTYVGYSPGAEVRMFEGDTSWDIGFVTWDSGTLRYSGERCSISVRPDQVEQVDIRSHRSIFVGSLPRIYIAWRKDSTSEVETFSVECRNAGSVREYRALALELFDKIQTWRQQSSSPVAAESQQ